MYPPPDARVPNQEEFKAGMDPGAYLDKAAEKFSDAMG